MSLSPDAKDRLAIVFTVARTAFHWGFIPTVLYLGFKKGSEDGHLPLTVFSLLWN